MSCFVVSDYHVSALVAWAVAHGVDLATSPDSVAHMLASANRRAYSDRYAGRYDSDLAPFGGLDRSAGVDLAPVAVVKACDCLDYQASDWSAWYGSEPSAHLAVIRARAVSLALAAHRITPGPNAGGLDYGRELPGYDAAAWSLDVPDTWAPDPVLAAHRLAARGAA